MMEGFHSMIDRYNEQKRQLRNRRPWVDSTKRPGVPPSAMTVTHVNQTKDLYVRCVICSLIFSFVKLATSSGKLNVVVWRPSVCLSHFFS